MASETHNILVRRAFSLVEMLAVLAILAILIALGVPAIKSMIYSSERSLAENQLRVAMTAARDAAVRSGGGDAAAVFFYQDQRTVIIPCVSVGRITDRVVVGGQPSATPVDVEREVFVPMEGIEPIRMPRGWNVRGYAAPGIIATSAQAAGNTTGCYDGVQSLPLAIALRGNWLFPETSFLDMPGLEGSTRGEDEGWKRQTFMIRFEAGTGNAAISAREPVLVLDPLPVLSAEGFRSRRPYNNDATLGPGGENDPTQAATLEAFVRQAIGRGILRTNDPTHLTLMLGDASPDTVLALPVTEFALYDEERMAIAAGAVGVNKTTGCVYGDPGDATIVPTEPMLDTSLFAGYSVDEIQERINAYMTRDVGSTPVLEEGQPLEARVFTVLRYMGQVQEVTLETEE
jgi:prepilin-type N-terminal cleavage/methylation domain-containing protein